MVLFKGWRRPAGLTLMIFATICGIAGLWLFPQAGRVNFAWFSYIFSVVFFIAALFGLFGYREKNPNPLFVEWKYALSYSIILSLAILMRLYIISSIPFGTWFDEADIGQYIQRTVIGSRDLPVFNSFHSLPLHFPYLVSLSFRLFGANTLSIRIVTAVFGLITVGAAYFLGNEIISPRFGLIFAFFFGVGRWHVTFSRLGLATVTTPFFVMLTFYFLFRGMRTKQPLDFGLAGISMGIGLDFHVTFRVLPIAVVLFFLHWMVRQWFDRSSGIPLRIWVIILAVFLLGAGLAVSPVAQHAIREPDSFWDRTSIVSIFKNRSEPNLGRALVSNAVDHLLMFNYQGDRNGRHNLPGEPMLDPISGALFIFGLGLALTRLKQPAEYSFLLLFLVGLSAGIFSVDFESPQAQRSIAAVPAVYFFTSLAVESIWRGLERSRYTQIRLAFLTGLILGVGGFVVYFNARTYFVRQANDPRVWGAHNPTETLVGIALSNLDPDETTAYVSMFLHNHKVIQFLAPDFGETKTVIPPDVMQFREPGDKSIVLFIDREQEWVVDAVRKLYPGAQYSVFFDPLGNPALHKVQVSTEEIQAIQGLTVRYWRGNKSEGEPTTSRTEKNLNVFWLAESPLELPFIAEWDGILNISQFGEYHLRLESPGEANVWVDERLVLKKDSGEKKAVSVHLSQGNHTLRVQAAGGDGLARLSWRTNPEEEFETIPSQALYLSPPISSNGLLGTYYEGGNWDSQPSMVRIDPFIDMYFHLIPLQRPYGVEWEGEIEIPSSGEYELGLRVNGEAQLYINEELLVDASQPTEYKGEKIHLIEGRHELRLRYLDFLGGSRIHLYWSKPGENQSVIPSIVLFPKHKLVLSGSD